MENGFQLVMSLNCGVNIPEDDPVRLLNTVMERMDYRRVFAAYSREGRIEYSPKILTKILVYGYMRRIISSRTKTKTITENKTITNIFVMKSTIFSKTYCIFP